MDPKRPKKGSYRALSHSEGHLTNLKSREKIISIHINALQFLRTIDIYFKDPIEILGLKMDIFVMLCGAGYH